MKLKNKKTGEIMDDVQYRNYSLPDGFGFRVNGKEWEYHSLAELNEEWEDWEEPKEYWYIDDAGVIQIDQVLSSEINMRKSIGNYFTTKEEAEKAVEKLKAWKRLKDTITRIDRASFDDVGTATLFIRYGKEHHKKVKDDLDLLFGGEE